MPNPPLDVEFNKQRYALYLRSITTARENHIAFAKWILATSITMHAGALVAGSNAIGAEAFLNGWPCLAFFGGISFAWLSGICAWINWQVIEIATADYLDPGDWVFATNKWPRDPDGFSNSRMIRIRVSYYLAAGFAIFSWVLFVAGIVLLKCLL